MSRAPVNRACAGELRIIKSMTEQILRNPYGLGKDAWTTQGFGMLRLYLPDKPLRLHVWDSRYMVPGVSLIHDHPWDFKSLVVAGRLRNIRYLRSKYAHMTDENIYMEQTIQCGPGGCVKGEPTPVKLIEQDIELYEAGDWYNQRADEIHMSIPEHGTVTIIDRSFSEDTEHARVYWKGQWGSAESRRATEDEVRSILSNSLERWFSK